MAMNNVPHSLTMLTIGLVICFTIAHDSIPKHLQISSYYTASEDLTVCLDECEKRFLKDYPKSLDACKKRCREKHARQNTNTENRKKCIQHCRVLYSDPEEFQVCRQDCLSRFPKTYEPEKGQRRENHIKKYPGSTAKCNAAYIQSPSQQ
ncbi:vicilin-like antimicrobial peptides 2-1 isoform X3 [Arachis ipaensis]|uniref:vicilin-like antimicrobial peptides 2-1 isoform X3 n=1 Tax=Arachis ipaensis TaxID=130454 RepID=UPI000A2AF2D7|nr:vicilin-like antimicrobial peptides 2-1 isoform X3 [Arachis ipaensis]XP_025643735.1 vicilin-like antimicrobial peptides 2-1 isoform X2 [Arachis hypogaea]